MTEKVKQDPTGQTVAFDGETLEAKWHEVCKLFLTGMNRTSIAKKVGVNRNQVSKWWKDPVFAALKDEYLRQSALDFRAEQRAMRKKALAVFDRLLVSGEELSQRHVASEILKWPGMDMLTLDEGGKALKDMSLEELMASAKELMGGLEKGSGNDK